MTQVLNIFRKDVRHHWPEMLASVALLTVFAVEQPRVWVNRASVSRVMDRLVGALPFFMVLAWIFLIIRLVQSESLVGDRQFWITRPYQWQKLLAAKLLSVLFFIHLPLFISQLCLLRVAQFPVMSSIPGLLYIHLLFFLVMVLPPLTVGTITSGIGQASLVFLAMLSFLGGLVWLIATIPDMDFLTDATDSITAPVCLVAAVAVIAIQYMYRKSIMSRLLLVCAAVVVFLVMLLAPYEKLIKNDFPLATKEHPVPTHFALDRTVSFAHAKGKAVNSFLDNVQLEIPLQMTDIADKTVIEIRAVKLDLDLPDGQHWTSHWQSLYQIILPGRVRDWAGVKMKLPIYNRFANDAVKAHISLGFNVFHLGAGNEVRVTGDRLKLPGGASCLNDVSVDELKCFAALKQPGPMLAEAALPSADCAISQSVRIDPWAAAPAIFANLGSDSSPGLDFTPIAQFSFALERYHIFEDLQTRLPICPGTPLLVSKPEFQYSVREELDLGEIKLSDYVPGYPRRVMPPKSREELVPPTSLSSSLTGTATFSAHD